MRLERTYSTAIKPSIMLRETASTRSETEIPRNGIKYVTMYAITSASRDTTRLMVTWNRARCFADFINRARNRSESREIATRIALPITVLSRLRIARIRNRGEYELKNRMRRVGFLATRESSPVDEERR